jgi:hypothetical protein
VFGKSANGNNRSTGKSNVGRTRISGNEVGPCRMMMMMINCTFHGLGPLTYFDSELSSQTRTPLMGDQPIGRRPLYLQDSIPQRNADITSVLRARIEPTLSLYAS